MAELSDLRLSKSMKYTALYVAMRFFEHAPDIFEKNYEDGTIIKIDSSAQSVFINGEKKFLLDTHESFVKLECLNRLLSLGFSLKDFTLLGGGEGLKLKGYQVHFISWDTSFNESTLKEMHAQYKSRLVSGVLEYRTKIRNQEIYEYGLFEDKQIHLRKRFIANYHAPDFDIEENRVMKYVGKSKIVKVPYGIEELESSAFWDNQYIEEVTLPDTLTSLGGDTFYNCKNLRKVNIPRNVVLMGNNPFAGCPSIEIKNQSKAYLYEKGVLYSADKKTLIYCRIKGSETAFSVPEGVTVIGKHAFYLCDRFEKIVLPSTLEKMENNPFSGCSKLTLISNTKAYYIQDDVIYNGFKTAVVGALNKIKSKRLVLPEGVKTINRNSFWNCKGIETIVLPSSLIDIGYNPFVGCSNIRFESHTSNYKVVDDVLYNQNRSKIICYPAWKANGVVTIPDSVISLERGAFSGCSRMTGIHLHNVNLINKSCFTNCSSLKELYCSDLITYVGEWAFAYCSSLKKISIKEGTIVDNNALSNCSAVIEVRRNNSNYLFESDNLYTLESMQRGYMGSIDSILIDPPYNSHVDYIGYKDGGYKDGYYRFMEKRVSLAQRLLSNKGFLIINIDEGEVEGLTNLCGRFFDRSLITVHKWKKLHPFFDVNRSVNPNKKTVESEYIIICRKTCDAVLNHIKQPFIEGDKLQEKEDIVPEVFDCFGTTSSAKDEIKELFGKRDYFSTPKPVKLMKELIRATTSKKSLIMDFFAGSGTVGQACIELNVEDGGERKFILVSNNESNICEIVASKRIQKTIDRLGGSFVFMR